ncbi:MAG TPA: hypothetical protein VKX96_03575 [Chloroflexota bacterium]|jgi:hypothetical protein|nr:hypothetical protein [Chloroflexota bacterium]
MELVFERGHADAPVGHALVYFHNPGDGPTSATYLVVLPISLELTKYVPPLLAAQLPLPDTKNVGAIPLPPLPETVESLDYIRQLAELRNDDLIDAGSIPANDLARIMSVVGEIAQRYSELYQQHLQAAPREEPSLQLSGSTVSDVIYQLMSEQQKLTELAKLAGQLRYAVEGNDTRQIDETTDEILRLGHHLPGSYLVEALIEAIKQPGSTGRQLSALYLDRCYKLASADYGSLGKLDEEIRRLGGKL